MASVLFSVSIQTFHQQEICKKLLMFLQKNCFKVKVLSNSDILGGDMDENADILNPDDYQVIIAFNKKGYDRVKRLHQAGIPVIYSFSKDDYTEFIDGRSKYDHVLMFNAGKDIFTDGFITHMNLPFYVEDIDEMQPKSNVNIVVGVDNYRVLLRLFIILYTMSEYTVNAIVADRNGYLMVPEGENINFFTREDDVESLVKQADLVIGDKYLAMQGIMYRKPVIVVGECGYGGLLKAGNCIEQFKNDFCGRVDGKKEEYFPLKWVCQDVPLALELEKTELQEIIHRLERETKKNEEALSALISFYACSRQKK